MAASGRVELAHEPDFVIGRLTVSPSRRELVRDDGTREVIEHRVMQVLVALSKAEGNIVTRDELIMLCWDGRVVGDDSIHRVLSLLRKVASGIGAGSVEIETITKIGYRLTSRGSTTASARKHPEPEYVALSGGQSVVEPTRRNLLVGAGAIGAMAAAVGGANWYRKLSHPDVPSEIKSMMAQAKQLTSQGNREGQNQAIGIYRRVVELEPDYADGWGWLGIAYAVPSHSRERAENEQLRVRAEAAGKRALELEPGNVYGELAFAVALPFIGHWMERERHLRRALAADPDNEDTILFRSFMLQLVGRNAEAAQSYERLRSKPLDPANYNEKIRALWSAGRIEEADRAMEDAAALYPTQSTIWVTRFYIKMFGGDPGSAIAMGQRSGERPSDVDGPALEAWLAQARAIESRDPVQVELVSTAQLKRARVSAFGAGYAMRVLNALGKVDEAFAVADAYYFGRGFTVPDTPAPGSLFTPDQRLTTGLFEPVTRPMRADARFGRLVGELGLDRYWRESGVQPDYRRQA